MQTYLLVVLLLLGNAAAQQTGAAAPAAKPGSISGTVVRSDNGLPVPRARVTLQSQSAETSSRETRTDAAGAFSFTDVVAGKYGLMAQRAGTPGTGASVFRPLPLELAAGESLKDLVVRLQPTSAIVGLVLDEEGEPMPNIQVDVVRLRRTLYGNFATPIGSAATNDAGEFRIHDLPAGKYLVRAVMRISSPGVLYPATYAPSTSDRNKAAEFHLRPADELRAEITMVSQRAVSLKGKLQKPPAKDEKNHTVVYAIQCDVALDEISEQSVHHIGVDAEGNFAEEVLPGCYTLTTLTIDMSRMSSGALPTIGIPVRVEVGPEGAAGVQLSTQQRSSEFTLRGRIRSPEPVDFTRITVSFENYRGAPFAGGMQARVQKDGTFTTLAMPFRDMLPVAAPSSDIVFLVGVYASNMEQWYTKRILVAGKDVTATGVTANATDEIVIEVSPHGAELTGRVLAANGQPAHGVYVITTAEEQLAINPRELAQQTRTDQHGRFRIEGLRPGTHFVVATQTETEEAALDLDFLEMARQRGKRIKVEEKGNLNIELTVLADEQPAP